MSCGKIRFWYCTIHNGNGIFLPVPNADGLWKCQSCGRTVQANTMQVLDGI